MKHFIGMSGSYGCMPDYRTVCRTAGDAAESLGQVFELSGRKIKALRRDRYMDLGGDYGADYAEITECECDEPWEHDEGADPSDWKTPERLPVIFRMDKGDVVAVFPTLPGTNDPSTFTVYAHVGQHGTGSREWYARTSPATPEQYHDLFGELRVIYEDGDDAVDLDVIGRFSRKHYKIRSQNTIQVERKFHLA